MFKDSKTVIQVTAMVSMHCELGEMQNPPEDEPLGMPVRGHLDYMEVERPTHCGWHNSVDRESWTV